MAFPGQPRGPVSFDDFGLAEIEAELQLLAATEITIGWQGASGEAIHPGSDDKTVAEIAAYQELGTPRAPARPALEVTFSRNEKEFEQSCAKAVSDLVDGRTSTVGEAVKAIGEFAVAALRKVIDDSRSWAEPLAESTARGKGHSQPLFEMGTYRSEASWAERRGDVIVSQGGEDRE
jgi:hypothetical protein